jgi:hypothetical protein
MLSGLGDRGKNLNSLQAVSFDRRAGETTNVRETLFLLEGNPYLSDR